MKIYINGKFFCQPISGTQRYARELLNHFDRLLAQENPWNIEFEVLIPPCAQSVPKFNSIQVRAVGNKGGTKWEQIDLPRHCRGERLFTLSGGAPLFHARNIITIHDAAVVAAPGGYSRPYRLWHAAVCRNVAPRAEHIFTISKFSKSEIVKWYGAAPDKISVTYLGSEHFASLACDTSALARFGISGKYILAASVQNPNKNSDRLVQAVSHLGSSIPLVIAGGRDSRVYRKLSSMSAGGRFVGYVNDNELKTLYQNAACFVFPSLYEGFGLPPLEAMSCGCPVVVSKAASLPEVFDGAAIFCDPLDPADITAAIQRAIDSPPRADQLKTFASKFSWDRCARETLTALSSL